MAELRARLEALERRMERAEAALRERPLSAPGLHGVPVLFEDVAVRFSRQEWANLSEGQKEMYRSVMEDCALSKPELLLQLEREELSTPPESEAEAAEVSPELAVEPARQNCTSDDALLEMETMERGCREPEESGNVAEKSGNLVEESKNLIQEIWSLVGTSGNLIEEIWGVVEQNRSLTEENKSLTEENRSLTEENRSLTEENRSPAEENRRPAEENKSLAEENRSLAEENRSLAEENKSLTEENKSLAEENRSPAEENKNPAEESGDLMEESRNPAVPENCSTPPVPLEATAVLADLSQPTPSPPRPLSVHCQEAVGQNCSPPAAGDAEAGIPMEVPQEEVAAEKPSMPKTPSKGLEEDKGHEEEAVKHLGNTGQDLVADIPEEPGKEVTPDVHKTTEQADPSPGQPEKDSCVGRPMACQRNATREFYSCPICRKTFLLKINLLIHQRGHTNWVPYVCVHCDRKFMSKKKIRRHLRAWAVNGTCQPSELEGFLTVHQRRHSGHHLILCPCCNRSFTWVSDFVRQHWMYMGVRPHQCGICQKTFKRFSHLKVHQRIHRRQERPFPCANQVPLVVAPAAGDGVGSQAVTPRDGALLSDLEVSSQEREAAAGSQGVHPGVGSCC
uniref:Proteoglycan 4-like n=1 Tax=Taeniopygia guttata TaxID=59729 RepID=A0A674HGT1_TAEGU